MKFGAFQGLKEKLLGGGAAEKMTLCAYGKLPLYKDYILLECNDGPASEFKIWLDTGFGMTFEEYGGRAVTVDGPHRLLWRIDGGKRYAVASVWPSSDEGGLRKFPFSFFVVIPKGSLNGKSVAAGWLLLEQIWTALEDRYTRACGLKGIDEFYNEFRGQLIEAIDASGEGEFSLTVDEWIRALNSGDPQGYAGRLTQNIAGLIAACREFADHGADLAARLPLAPSIPLGAQVHIWERAFRENLKKCGGWPSMVMPTPPLSSGKSLTLIWRETRKDDCRLLGADLTGYDFVENIAEEMVNPQGLFASHPLPTGDFTADLDVWIKKVGGK